MNKTVGSLMANFPAWKNSVNRDPDAFIKEYRAQLFKTMEEVGVVNQGMIDRGLSKARASENPFLPAPGEFCAWCKPTAADAGLPDPEDAFNHARSEAGKHESIREWNHHAAYLATTAVGFFDMKTVGDKDRALHGLRSRFMAEYAKLVDRVLAGEDIGDTEYVRIEKQPYKKNKAAGEKAAASIMSMFDE